MSNIVARATAALDSDARMDAYYYSFERTGICAVDRILSEVAIAGKAYHHTAEWGHANSWKLEPPLHVDRIQDAAASAALLISELCAEVERLRRENQYHPSSRGCHD